MCRGDFFKSRDEGRENKAEVELEFKVRFSVRDFDDVWIAWNRVLLIFEDFIYFGFALFSKIFVKVL